MFVHGQPSSCREEVLKATEDILSDEGIRKQYSDDLEGVWHPKE